MLSKTLLIILSLLHATQCLTKTQIFSNETFETGFIPLTQNRDIFYWLFPSRSAPTTDPLVFWLTGG